LLFPSFYEKPEKDKNISIVEVQIPLRIKGKKQRITISILDFVIGKEYLAKVDHSWLNNQQSFKKGRIYHS